ncbi:MAG: glycerol-3-phosphate 1-O-acyltransferase PlsY [Alphaproteobacteria bacterium]|nr:glycerol-3-phosphate 1-O-acyltransferase PlsY [Alphaproteobacteria bacterium]
MSPAVLPVAIALVVGYLLGSIPFGLVLTRAAGLGDIRSIGSGNIGATNVLRTGNRKLAAAVLLLDAAKGLVAVLLASSLGAMPALAAGGGAVLGHMFPVWLGFKGGKGGATVLGVFLGLSWPIVAVGAGVWLLLLLTIRYSSLATLLSTAAGAASAWWLSPRPVAVLAALLVLLVWAKHHQNIRRLLAGTEPKVGQRKPATP